MFTVVGDIHGQLSDLIHILDHVGPLSSSNRLLFNGDFVDRGQESVEVITLIFAQLAAYGPDVIYLNRGDVYKTAGDSCNNTSSSSIIIIIIILLLNYHHHYHHHQYHHQYPRQP